MSTNNLLGIIFANVHDDLIPELTEKRSMASIPFGGRYRLIDFSLSNLVNAGVTKVGILTRANYQSLMDHLGSGKPWDLDRKNGGMFILPPYSTNATGVYRGHVDALAGTMTFLKRSIGEYVIMCDADVVSNIDVADMLEKHIEKGADVSIAYKYGDLPKNHKDTMILEVDKENIVTGIEVSKTMDTKVNFSLDVCIMKRQKLIELVEEADRNRLTSFAREVFKPKLASLKMFAYKVDGFAEVIDSYENYVNISNKLLEKSSREQVFNRERPIYTKIKDDMPTRYGIGSVIQNSFIADGCVIEGTVKNSILFRGVKVGKNAVVENCIVMQGGVIGENCKVKNVTMDKGANITDGVKISGTDSKYVFVPKDRTI